MISLFSSSPLHPEEPIVSAEKQLPHVRRKRTLKGLQLQLSGGHLYFKTLDDFSFAIECRTTVPSARFDKLLDHSAAELWQEAESVKAVEKNLVNILEDALCDGNPCGSAIRDLGLQLFSKDHDWRVLMEALNQLNDDYDGYKRLALIKYMQYLGSRQEILRLIFAMKNKGAPQDQTLQDDDGDGFGSRETVLFDVSQLRDGGSRPQALQRLPQGEAVRIHALPGHAVEIKLGRHAFTLVNDNGWALCDASGNRKALSDRQNTIGRGSENDITLGSEFRNVSRRHLIAEPADDQVILLTDISSHGTFAPALQTERRVG